MASPKEVYESDIYKAVSNGDNDVSVTWFKDVYEALGELLKMVEVEDKINLFDTNNIESMFRLEIMRHWDRGRIEKFCSHLTGDCPN